MLKTSRLASLVESIYFEKKTLNIEMRLDHQNVFSISGGKDLGEGLQNVSQLNLCKIAVKVNSRKGFSEFLRRMGSWQPRPQGFLVFQYAAVVAAVGKREDPGDEVGGHGDFWCPTGRIMGKFQKGRGS